MDYTSIDLSSAELNLVSTRTEAMKTGAILCGANNSTGGPESLPQAEGRCAS